jgi:ubiquinone/menaquinone biosynthesis C-methylase UbiE
VPPETPQQREKRRAQRVLFNSVADLYDATRQPYPEEVVEKVLATAGAGPGARILEIGCGTGQLTRRLAGRGLEITAIDIGPAMVSGARRVVADPQVNFHATSFEEFASTEPFDLILSATAFHWIDPELAWDKTCELLRPGGWLALLSTAERYAEPLRGQVRELWSTYSRVQIPWSDRPGWITTMQEAPQFGDMVEMSHEVDLRLPADTVLGVECTRATYLSYASEDQRGYRTDLAALLEHTPEVEVVQETFLAMAPALPRL